jgi:hypothetical protein
MLCSKRMKIRKLSANRAKYVDYLKLMRVVYLLTNEQVLDELRQKLSVGDKVCEAFHICAF